ncbi:MAG TPA: restriction endonuclease subunit S [Candidatus Cryosericum sp.]
MKSKWHTVRLGDVCQVNPDKRDSSWPHSVISYIDIASVGNGVLNEQPRTVLVAEAPGRAQRLVRAGDTIVSTVRPNRRSFLYVSEPASTTVVSTGFAVLRAEEGFDPRFLYYLVTDQSFTDYLVAHEEGSAYPAVNSSVLGDAKVAIPDLPEQRAIAHILGALDDKIELNRRMNETLESMARALFKSWFIDFDPVHVKAEGRDPGLPADIAALFPDSFEDSEFGEIPKGWRVTSLQDVLAECETGSRPAGGVSKYPAGVPSVGAESIVGLGAFDYSKTKYVPRSFFDSMTKGHVRSRDVLLYKDGGRPGEFEPHVTLFGDGFPFSEYGINEHVYRMRVSDKLGQNLLYFWLSSDLVMEEMRIKGTGVAIPGLNSTQVKSLPMLIPTRGIAAAFDALAEPCIARLLAGCTESRKLALLRDTLLPRLMSGQLELASLGSV